MGCDIHLIVEHKHIGRWWSFGCHPINPGRDYRVFGALANVRCFDAKAITPRGFPTDASWAARDAYSLFVSDGDGSFSEGSCSRDEAAKWIASRSSEPFGEDRITNPDWHSPSWLTDDEFRAALERAPEHDVGYDAIAAVLKTFEDAGHETRVVFWFDN